MGTNAGISSLRNARQIISFPPKDPAQRSTAWRGVHVVVFTTTTTTTTAPLATRDGYIGHPRVPPINVAGTTPV